MANTDKWYAAARNWYIDGLSPAIFDNLSSLDLIDLVNLYKKLKNWLGISKLNNPFSKGNMSSMKGVGWGMAAEAASAIGLSDKYKRGLYDIADPTFHLANNRTSKAGNFLSDTGVSLFKLGASSGNPWMMLAGGVSKIFGSLTNAAWGNDEEALAKYDENALLLNNYQVDLSSYDSIALSMASMPVWNLNVDRSSFGWFNGSDYDDYIKKRDNAVSFVDRTNNNAIGTKLTETLNNLEANYVAFGGKIKHKTYSEGDIINISPKELKKLLSLGYTFEYVN